MKIRASQLRSYLGKYSLYFIHGDEPILAQGVLKQIQDYYKGYLREVVYLDREFDWLTFGQRLQPTLNYEKSLIEWYWLEGFKNQEGKKLLQVLTHLGELPLVITSRREQSYLKATWWSMLDERGLIVDIWPLSEEREVTTWLINKAKQEYAFTFTRGGIELILRSLNKDLVAMQHLLGRAGLLYLKGKELGEEEVVNLLGEPGQYSLYDLLNAVWEGKVMEVVKRVNYLRMDLAPALLVWGIEGDLGVLWGLNTLAGDSETYLTKIKIPFNRRKGLKKVAPNLKPKILCYWWKQLYQLDQVVKTGSKEGVFWHEALKLLVEMSRGVG